MARPTFEIKNPRSALVFGGVVLLLTSLWLGATVRFAFHSVVAVGEVTSTYPCRLGRRSGTCGDVTFHRADGPDGHVTGVQGSGPKGSRVDVIYDPAHSEDARLNGPVKLWAGPVGFELLGLLFFGSGLQKFRRAGSR